MSTSCVLALVGAFASGAALQAPNQSLCHKDQDCVLSKFSCGFCGRCPDEPPYAIDQKSLARLQAECEVDATRLLPVACSPCPPPNPAALVPDKGAQEIKDRPFVLRLLESGAPPKGESDRIREADVLAGGMPVVALGEARDRDLWFLGYERTYLERDVRSLAQVADLVDFRNLLRLAALRGGQLLNVSELARDAKMTTATANRYLGLLETSFVITRLAPHLRSKTTRLIKSPKLYVADSGLAAHLTDVRDLHAAADEPLRGALFETYVHQNLFGILAAQEERVELTFWNVQGRHEVDFVLTSGRRSLAIEVKAASRFTERDTSGLRAFLDSTTGAVAGVLAYDGHEVVSLGDRIFAVPLARIIHDDGHRRRGTACALSRAR